MTFGKDFTQAVEQKQIAQQGSSSLALLSPASFPFTDLLLLTFRRGRARQVHRRARTSLPPPLPFPSLLPSLTPPPRPQSEQERQAAVVRAEGEAEAATIISRALSKAGDGLVQFRRIEASKDIAGTLAQVRSLLPLSFPPFLPCSCCFCYVALLLYEANFDLLSFAPPLTFSAGSQRHLPPRRWQRSPLRRQPSVDACRPLSLLYISQQSLLMETKRNEAPKDAIPRTRSPGCGERCLPLLVLGCLLA